MLNESKKQYTDIKILFDGKIQFHTDVRTNPVTEIDVVANGKSLIIDSNKKHQKTLDELKQYKELLDEITREADKWSRLYHRQLNVNSRLKGQIIKNINKSKEQLRSLREKYKG